MTTVLLTAIGSMSARAVIEGLRGAGPVRIIGCDIHPAAWLDTARDVDACHRAPLASDATAYLSFIETLCQREGVSHLMALTDVEVDLLVDARERLAAVGCEVCLPAGPAVPRMRDKFAWFEALRANPKTPVIPSRLLAQGPDPAWSYPLVAKPRQGRSMQGFSRLHNSLALDSLVATVAPDDYLLQPAMSSSVFVVDVLRNAVSGKTAAVCREELLRTSNGAGLTVRLTPDAALAEQASAVADAVGLHGCANFEFLHQAGEYLLMDINPRFSAGVGFSHAAGYPMVAETLGLFLGREIADVQPYVSRIFTRDIGHILEL